ncbi:MAG: peptide-methionine (R)-S-oxide reductase [Chitinophagaceae bacterium]|nr:MAG: peptide-methionine (R)-S-oxide reductase [Chitinophagaceae bacterium]
MEGSLREHESSTGISPHSNGTYVCAICGTALFEAEKKFDAGCGFPSFWMHKDDNVKENLLQTYGRTRIQLLCNNCGAHLGHLFTSKHTPTGLRYCINENAIRLKDV